MLGDAERLFFFSMTLICCRVLLHLVSVNGEKVDGMAGPGSRRGETGDL